VPLKVLVVLPLLPLLLALAVGFQRVYEEARWVVVVDLPAFAFVVEQQAVLVVVGGLLVLPLLDLAFEFVVEQQAVLVVVVGLLVLPLLLALAVGFQRVYEEARWVVVVGLPVFAFVAKIPHLEQPRLHS